jgi:hypothetical protein
MENAITGLIIIGVLVLAILGLTQSSLATQAAMAEATRLMQTRLTEQARTNLTALSASTSGIGNTVYITVKNTGTTKLADFEHWDVIVQYADTLGTLHLEWSPYGEWTQQIYASAPLTLEQIEPNILDPGEEMVISAPVAFTVGPDTTDQATVATPNGIVVTAVFTR